MRTLVVSVWIVSADLLSITDLIFLMHLYAEMFYHFRNLTGKTFMQQNDAETIRRSEDVMVKERKKPVGRPREYPGEVKRSPLNLRTTRDRRRQLEESARKSGRSLAREVEHLLDKAMNDEQTIPEGFGGPENYNTFKTLAAAVQMMSAKMGGEWLDDPEIYRKTEPVLISTLRAFAPKANGKGFGRTLSKDGKKVAALILIRAAFDLRGIKTETEKEEELWRTAEKIRKLRDRNRNGP